MCLTILSRRDRFRTAVNVWGDSIGAGILNHIFRDLFKDQEGDATALQEETDSDGSRSSIKKEKLIDGNDAVGPGGLANPAFENDGHFQATKL